MTTRITFSLKIHLLFCIFFSLEYSELIAQIVNGNGYLMGASVEVGISGSAGHEGTLDIPGSHARGGDPSVPLGFVANPARDNWNVYNGDFFTAGSPENGFGIEINGRNYSNNAWNAAALAPLLQEIPQAPGSVIQYLDNDGCLSIEWEGIISDVRINVKYTLNETALFYTTEVTLTNEGVTDLTDLYYYRNVDPDNNESIGGSFTTTNTIENQPSPDCAKALVFSQQSVPHESYLGLGALGEKFRVSHGGFSNRTASDIWNAANGLEGTEGVAKTEDASISLAYKTDLLAGASENFKYTVVLEAQAVEAAIASLYFVSYLTEFGERGGIASSSCNLEGLVVETCLGPWIDLTINGPSLGDYSWRWSDGTMGTSVRLEPTRPGSYGVRGTPIGDCLQSTIVKTVIVSLDAGPKIEIVYDDLICGGLPVDDLILESTGVPATSCIYLTEKPDSANQVTPEFPATEIVSGDEIWILCKDDATGCYDYSTPKLLFVGLFPAGGDTIGRICTTPDMTLDLQSYLKDTAIIGGDFYLYEDPDYIALPSSLIDVGDLEGDYYYYYIFPAFEDCAQDTAEIHLIFNKSPVASFDLEVSGASSADGLVSGCVSSPFDFVNNSSIDPPETIDSFLWDFGDGTTSSERDPSHSFTEEQDEFSISLVIEGSNGCRSEITAGIGAYDSPPMTITSSPAVCNGDENGIITVFPEIIEPFTVNILDHLGVRVNDSPTQAIDLDEGDYSVELIDASGCTSSQSISLVDPPFIEVYYRVSNIVCAGDLGWIKVDSVAGESFNNVINYNWSPDPSNSSGVKIDSDSLYRIVSGDYMLTVTDGNGCTNTVSFEFGDPPPFNFVDVGWDTSYCRNSAFQNGGGAVWGLVEGGIPDYEYLWTYLVDGTTSSMARWENRSGGEHLLVVKDANGCTLSQMVNVDSLNPIASFQIVSADLDSTFSGTADAKVEFVNTSQNFEGPNVVSGDTAFFWDLSHTDEFNWDITDSYFYQPDTIYGSDGIFYNVDACLIAFNGNGCSDTTCKKITIFEPTVIVSPNIFTPNGSGENDVFTFDFLSTGISKFECVIVNRWGVTVGEINAISDSWDGTNMLNGEQCTDGVYFYTYIARGHDKKQFGGQGTVTIVDSGVEE